MNKIPKSATLLFFLMISKSATFTSCKCYFAIRNAFLVTAECSFHNENDVGTDGLCTYRTPVGAWGLSWGFA